MTSRTFEHDGTQVVITNGSVPLDDPADYDCIICESHDCQCQSEMDRVFALSPEDLDAELLAEGIDPELLRARGNEFMCQLFASQGIVIASLGMGLDCIENVAGAGI